jgi:hypothetical protein
MVQTDTFSATARRRRVQRLSRQYANVDRHGGENRRHLVAIPDRLVHHCEAVIIEGKSFNTEKDE